MTALFHGAALVLANEPMAQDTYRIRIQAPELACAILPGQFLMLKIAGTTDPLLGRPFALYDTVLDATDRPFAVDIVYLVVGKMTGQLAGVRAGERIDIWGPLGREFPELHGVDHVGLVAGGIGQTPFLAYIRQLLGKQGYGSRSAVQTVRRVSLFYGVRSASHFAGVDELRAAGAEVHLATDDGSLGFHGYVTQLLLKHEMPQNLVGCGPEPMMKALAGVAAQRNIPLHLSLETPMACGLGICFSCVTKVKTADGCDYRRVCVEGPVFNAADLVWDDSPTH